MQISSSFETQKIWNLTSYAAPEKGQSGNSQEDTADISLEARKLYSKMIHRYDKPGSNEEPQNGEKAQSGGSASESVDEKIASLKSQLAALAAQISGGAADAGVISKMNALQAQISALEAQKNSAA